MGRYEVVLTQVEQTYITSLTIHQVEPVEGGNYKLRVANKFGELNATMSLIVNGKTLSLTHTENNLNILISLLICLSTICRLFELGELMFYVYFFRH